MKSSVRSKFLYFARATGVTLSLVFAFSISASAQDTPDSAGEEAKATPVLVVHEVWKAAPEIKPEVPAARPAKSVKGTPKPTVESAQTGQPASASGTPNLPSPIVMGKTRSFNGSLLDTTGNPAYDQLALDAGNRHGVDPNLIVAVMRQESGFNSRAVSYKGASGLMQLMPATARRFGVTNIFDPIQNVDAGARYLRFLLDTFNDDVSLTLAGYNAGENAVIRNGYQIPRYRETQNYVRSISARYGKTYRGTSTAPVANPTAPEAVALSAGRLSNNY